LDFIHPLPKVRVGGAAEGSDFIGQRGHLEVVSRVVHGAEAMPSILCKLSTLDKIDLSSRDCIDDLDQAQVVPSVPRGCSPNGFITLNLVGGYMYSGHIAIVIYTMVCLGKTEGDESGPSMYFQRFSRLSVRDALISHSP
jgi:hypothetical protein